MTCSAFFVSIFLVCNSVGIAASVPISSSVSMDNAVVPHNDRAYECMDTLQKAGIVIAFPDGTGGNVLERRSQFAVAVARLLPLLLPSHDLSPEPVALRRDIHQKLIQNNQKALTALLTLIDEFTPEIRKYSPAVVQAREQLVQLHTKLTPFSDVPKDHWAYQAVEQVRKAGIMIGYPGREFRTDDTKKGTPQ